MAGIKKYLIFCDLHFTLFVRLYHISKAVLIKQLLSLSGDGRRG